MADEKHIDLDEAAALIDELVQTRGLSVAGQLDRLTMAVYRLQRHARAELLRNSTPAEEKGASIHAPINDWKVRWPRGEDPQPSANAAAEGEGEQATDDALEREEASGRERFHQRTGEGRCCAGAQQAGRRALYDHGYQAAERKAGERVDDHLFEAASLAANNIELEERLAAWEPIVRAAIVWGADTGGIRGDDNDVRAERALQAAVDALKPEHRPGGAE